MIHSLDLDALPSKQNWGSISKEEDLIVVLGTQIISSAIIV